MTAFLFLIAAAAAPQAATPAPAMPAAPAVAADPNRGDPNRKVCRSSRYVGSAIPKRVCRTQAQWNELDRASVTEDPRMLDSRRFGSTPSGS